MKTRIGLDLGGTKIEAVAIDRHGTELARQRTPTPAGDYQGIVAAVAHLVAVVAAEAGETEEVVGIGTPGTISPVSGLMKNSNSTALNGQPLDQDLSAALGRPIIMRNDADCFAVSEATDGAAQGFRTVFGAIIGTGVGGGWVVNGWPVAGPNAIAGEWGHNPLPWPRPDELPGSECYCGRSGCIETWLSGRGLADDHARHGGQSTTSEDIVRESRLGDPLAAASMERYLDRLARGLATVINLFDPEVVVLGGGMSNNDELYQGVEARWGRYVFSDHVATRLVRNRHGDSSGVRGAAYLVP
jgi:fructokinase